MVSQNGGCTRLFSHPAAHLSAQPWSHQFVTAAAVLHHRAQKGWDALWHESRQQASGLGRWVTVLVCTHILPDCTLLSTALPLPHILTHTKRCAYSDPLWWLWQPFVRSKRFRSKQNQSPPPSSVAESSGAHSVPASLFKSGLKRRADLHSTPTFGKKKNWRKTWWT